MKPLILLLIVIVSSALSGCNKQKVNPPTSNHPLELPSSQDSHSIVQKKSVSDPQEDQKVVEARNTLRSLLRAIEEKDQAKINHLTTAYGRESLSKLVSGYHREGRLRNLHQLADGQIKAKWEVEGKNNVSVTNERVGLLIFVKEPHWMLKVYALRFD